jgi:hypothetical protein
MTTTGYVAPAGGPQHLRALEKANRIRLARSGKKRRIKMGELSVAEALVDPDFATATVDEVLMAQHRWHRSRTRRALLRVSIPEKKVIATLTERQRLGLVAELDGV